MNYDHRLELEERDKAIRFYMKRGYTLDEARDQAAEDERKIQEQRKREDEEYRG